MNTTTNTRGVSEAMVERAAFAMERARKPQYTDEQFGIWWTRDPWFCEHRTSWGFFEGTRKGLALWEARVALEAALSAEPAAQGDGLCQRNPAPNAAPAVGMTSAQRIVYLSPEGTAPPAQPAERVPEGTWLWCKLMDWCKARRVPPAEYSDLFAIAGEAHKLASPAPSEGGKGMEFCGVCRKPFGPTETRVGTGDGTMRANNGRGSFAHRHCYEAAAQQAAR